MFENKKILIGITGGIAVYKTCEIVRYLIKNNAQVKVVMTEAAKQFISPLTFETLSGNPVDSQLFAESTIHIDRARWGDCILICPATANTMNKVANGIADNLLTTLLLAADVPIIFCPAMNKVMYLNPIFQSNVKKLQELHYNIVDAAKGELACNEEGWGRLADNLDIINKLKHIVLGTKELAGKKILITAGRTEEPLDPVRILTNYSTGKMGFALAEAAALKGADVTLISGPNNLVPFSQVKYEEIKTADQMHQAVLKNSDSADVIIMAAAVADYKPIHYINNKIKKNDDDLNLRLARTTDILNELGIRKKKQILVGFAVETENEIENSRKKLTKKNLDFIVLNNPLEEGTAFASENNRVTLIDKSTIKKLPLMTKYNVAVKILDEIIPIINNE